MRPAIEVARSQGQLLKRVTFVPGELLQGAGVLQLALARMPHTAQTEQWCSRCPGPLS